MNEDVRIDSNTTTASTTYRFLSNYLTKSTPSTSYQSTTRIQPGIPALEVVDKSILDQPPSTKGYNSTFSEDDISEQEWHSIVKAPRVRNALRRLAAEARQQAAKGEIEEGGFAIE